MDDFENETKSRQVTEIQHPRTRLEQVIPLPAPFTVYIDPCGSCNFKCSFCPCNNSSYNSKERHRMMPTEIFDRTLQGLKNWRNAGTPVKVVNLYAFGEPLLNPRIVDMLKSIKENDVCREVRLTTNASLLTPSLGQSLIDAGLDHLRVSVEALGSEGYRETCGVNVPFGKIVENVEEYFRRSRKTDCKIDVKIISSALQTSDDEKKFYDIFENISDTHFIEQVGEIWPDFDEMVMPENVGASGRKISYNNEAREHRICTFPFTDMVVHSDGTVSACCVDWKGLTSYGNVKEETLDAIWNNKDHRSLQIMHLDRSAYSKTICGKCKRIPLDNIDDFSDDILKRYEQI